MSPAAKIIYLVTEEWFFLSHFLERALAARASGFEVIVAARDNGESGTIKAHGLRFAPIPFNRRGFGPAELGTIAAIRKLYRAERPALVHHVALKPILYGSMVAPRGTAIVNAPVGMGFVFSSQRASARVLRPVVRGMLRRLLNPAQSRVVFENRDDLTQFVNDGSVRPADAVLIRGAGVDVEAIVPMAEPEGTVRVVLIGRMLRDKGIGEFVAAAKSLRAQGRDMKFALVGAPDPQNPASYTEAELLAINREGIVEWLGFRSDIAQVIGDSHIVALPSYREGLPKTLIEAMAAGRAIVTTDVTGCREAVTDGVNGLLVPPRDPDALAAAIARLADDPALRGKLAAAGRHLAETEFSTARVTRETLETYRGLLRTSG